MLVQMNRVDKASQVLAKMQQMDDDSTLTELVKGWVCTGQGQNKQEQALYAFEELVRSSSGMFFISRIPYSWAQCCQRPTQLT